MRQKNGRFSGGFADWTINVPSGLEKPLRKSTAWGTLTTSFLVVRVPHAHRLRAGYARVSKSDGSQLLDLQLDALQQAGVNPARIYQDQASGRKDQRPGLMACLKALQPGNTLIVWKLDRLGRDLKHLVTLVDDLKDRDVGFRVLTGASAEMDTTTPNGRLVFGIFASLAEFERDLIAERTKAGLAAARARGRNGGRPRKMDRKMLRLVMTAMADRETKAADLAKQLGITTTTIYTYVNGDGSPKAAGQQLLDTVA